ATPSPTRLAPGWARVPTPGPCRTGGWTAAWPSSTSCSAPWTPASAPASSVCSSTSGRSWRSSACLSRTAGGPSAPSPWATPPPAPAHPSPPSATAPTGEQRLCAVPSPCGSDLHTDVVGPRTGGLGELGAEVLRRGRGELAGVVAADVGPAVLPALPQRAGV